MNLLTQLTPIQLRQAADILEQIESLKKELDQVLAFEVAASVPAIEAPQPPTKRRRTISPEARAKMAAAQRARRAAERGEFAGPVEVESKETSAAEREKPKKKRTMTEAWRRALARAQAARWAKAKARAASSAPAEKASAKPKNKQISEARLKALAKAREARWAKARAANDDVPF